MSIYKFLLNVRAKAAKKLSAFFKNNKGKLATWVFRSIAAGIFVVSLLFIYYSKDLPDPNKLLSRSVPESSKIFARDGTTLLYEIHGEAKRTLVNLDQISPNLKNATIAIEDKDFYKHSGISVTGLMRSVLVDVISGQKKQGGSTITQQFIKNAVLSRDKSLSRKLKEIILSIEMEARFSKDDILKLYLNEIPYGRNAYGVEAASQTYFNKKASDLSLAESAYLAGLPQAPTFYNPSGPNRDSLDAREHTILEQMKNQGYISEDDYKKALDEKVVFSQIKNTILAPHFVFYVQDYLAKKYGEKTLEEGGLKVYTTIDPRMQQIAETAVKEGVEKNASKYKANNAALVAMDPKTGQILAMVGSKDYFADSSPAGCNPGKNCVFEPQVNVAVSQRQPGSSFKPYAYVTAFKKEFGYTPASPLMDVITNFGNYGGKEYIPKNYSGEQFGPVSMRQALAGSLNVPAVKTLALVGVENVTQTARDLGITSPLANCGLALVLGGCEVRLVDHVAAFNVLANGGNKNEKTAILKILDKQGNTLEEYQQESLQVLDPQAVYELTSIMTDNNARSYIFGANSPLILPGRPVAAKTGTTQNWHDGWTLGFTPSLTAGVWAGNNDGTLLKPGADGVFVAAPIWNRFMKEVLAGTAAEQFIVPDGITKVTVDAVSGKLPTEYTASTKAETFASYSVPRDRDNVHVPVKIDTSTGQPATELTAPDQVQVKVYTVLHSEKPNNPAWENPVIAWALAHGYEYPPNGNVYTTPSSPTDNKPQASITEPQDKAIIAKVPFQVSVSASSGNGIARVDLSIDGSLVESGTSSPFNFTINKKYSDGTHTITAHVVDSVGASTDTSTTVRFQIDQPITILDPENGTILDFPATITAQSGEQYESVLFYYQSGVISKLIGPADNTSNTDGLYYYSVTWKTKPKPGTYKLYARTEIGDATPKITVTVP